MSYDELELAEAVSAGAEFMDAIDANVTDDAELWFWVVNPATLNMEDTETRGGRGGCVMAQHHPSGSVQSKDYGLDISGPDSILTGFAQITRSPFGTMSGPGAAETAPALAEPDWRSDVPNVTCSVDGCEKPAKSRRWCEMHYSRWKRHGDPMAIKVTRTPDGLCLVGHCTEIARRRGWCGAHFQRWLAHGDPLGCASRPDQRILFLDHVTVDQETGCWLWTGQLTAAGYGRSADYGLGDRMAHRVAYLMFVGPIPDGLELDHVWANGCRYHNCVNWVDHLEPVTHQENMRRAAAARTPLDRCRSGHPYDEQNTYINPSSGRRICRACALQGRQLRTGRTA